MKAVTRQTRFFPVALVVLAVAALSVACGKDKKQTPTPTPTATAIATDYPSEVQLTDADAGSSVKLANGGQLIVALASNATTGYTWSVQDPSPAQLELQGEPKYVPPGSTSNVVGAAGTQVFTFVAKSAGSAKLTLEYKRPFEPNVAPDKTFSVTVDVR